MLESGSSELHTAKVDLLHDELREMILTAKLPPGMALSQVRLAREFGVGRSPLREAMRMLVREHFLDMSFNQRVRVAATSPVELEQVYARRIMLETVAVRVTVGALTAAELDRLEELLDRMGAFVGGVDKRLDEWEEPHKEFHRLLISHAGARILTEVQHLQDHAARYRAVFGRGVPEVLELAASEHAALLAACRDRDRAAASRVLARHLGRAGKARLAACDPAHVPVLLPEAVATAGGG